MTKRSAYRSEESFEQRVLAALAMGASAPEEIAAGLTESPERVRQALDQAVTAEAVSRLDLPGGATYTLSPKGRAILGLVPEQAVAAPVAPLAPVAPQSVPGEPEVSAGLPSVAPDPVAAIPPVGQAKTDAAARKVQWRHVAYAVAYVLIGLFLVMLQPVVGVLAILAGLGLGAWALRPLFT